MRAVRRGAMVAGALVATLLTLPHPATAWQRTDPAGTWEATWANAIRHESDGSITVQKTSSATLRLELDGDSLSGTWTTRIPGEGHVWVVEGTWRDGRLTLVSTRVREGELPGDALARVVKQEWVGGLEGERLVGNHWLILQLATGDQRRSGPRPWSAEPARAGSERADDPSELRDLRASWALHPLPSPGSRGRSPT